MTGNDLIASALRLINVLASGEVPSGAEAADALVILNQMLESWSADRLEIFSVNRSALFPLVAGQQTYLMGTGAADFNTSRPAVISRMGIISQPSSSQPLELPLNYMTDDEWAQIPVKNVQSALPLNVWDDQNFPYRGLNFWPIPNVAVSVVFYAWAALTSFVDLTTDTTFPPGYARALRYNLAVELAGEFGAQVTPAVMAIATEALAKIERLNAPLLDLRCDSALANPRGGIYNWITDGSGRSGSY